MNIDIMAKTTVYKSSWVADGFDVLFSIIYLLENHKDLCIPFNKITKEGVKDLSDIIVYWTHNNYSGKAKQNEYFIEFPGGEKKFGQSLATCFKNTKLNFIVLPIGIRFSSGSGGHFNIILIDKKRKTIERFEPYGVETLDDLKIMTLFEKTIKGVINKIDKGYKLLSGNKLCPEEGLQFIEEKNIEKGVGTAIDLDSDPIGYCIAWSIYYVDMRLKNREINPNKLIKLLLKNIDNYHHSHRTFIRSYSKYLNNEKTRFLKKLNTKINKSGAKKSTHKFSKDLENELTKYFLDKMGKKK
jgi:hypothetical protein